MSLLVLSEEVREAVAARVPLVALETTLVSHGFPRGEGAEVARTCERLHLPAYSLTRSPIADAALAAARRARAGGAKISVDLSATSAIRELGVDPFRTLLADLRPDVVFANEAEQELIGDLGAPVVAVKRGARGCLIRRDGVTEELAARPTDVVDTTGAGDAFAAGFLIGGPALALEAAARCVSSMGAFPP